jgi:hypothetical protein
LQSYFLGELKPHTKIQNPTISPSGRKETAGERGSYLMILVDT